MKNNTLLLSLLMSSSLLLTACGQEDDRWSIEIGDNVSDNQDSGSNTDTDSNTDTATGGDPNTESDTGAGTHNGSNSDSGDDSNTNSDSNNDTNNGSNADADSSTDTDSSSDTDSNTNPEDNTSDQVQAALLLTPAPNSELQKSSFTLTPSNTQAKKWLDVGTTLGGEELFNGAINGATDINNIPLNGEPLYITLWSEIDGQWQKQQYTLNTINVNSGSDTGTKPETETDTDTDTENNTKPTSFNQAPLAMNGALVLLAGQTVKGIVSADDIEGDDLTFEVVDQPQSGAITLNNSTGEFSYAAGNSTTGNSDTFSYRVFDGEQYSNTAQITLRYSQHAGTTLQGRGDGIGADLVIIGDGFTQSEMGQFKDAVNDYVDFMFAYEPEFKNHQKAWNIHRVDLVSQQSGADNSSGNNQVNTALDGYFNCGDIDRLLCVSSAKTFAAVNQAFPQWDNILVIVNSSKYGGAGYSSGIGTVSLSGAAKDVGLHEMAHSFAGLADEYTYGGSRAPTREPGAANSTINNNLDSVKWKHWLGTGSGNGTIGLFEGGQYVSNGVWRPTENSIMRSLGNAFHAVNKEAWTLAVYEHGGVYHSKQPVSALVNQLPGNDTQFKVDTVMGEGAQKLVWFVNNQVQTSLTNQHQVSLGADQNAPFTVRVKISDNTGNIRKDDNGHANDSITWEVNVQ